MSKRGVRSQQAQKRQTERQIRYALKKIIQNESYRDPIWAETVCMTAHKNLIDFGYTLFKENFSTTYIPSVDKGDVLADSRGRGAFQ